MARSTTRAPRSFAIPSTGARTGAAGSPPVFYPDETGRRHFIRV